jgi:hypothetical protein
MAEASMPNKKILIINPGPNVGIGLGDFRIRARWIVYFRRGFRD